MTDTPLSQLCTICHSNPPKYTCPRDDTQTCSLRCVQTHKKQALCNGRRDPAAYVRKDDLHTPAGVDRDFNFLTGVERGLERAETDALGRGIPVVRAQAEGDDFYAYGGAKRKFGGGGVGGGGRGNREKLGRAIGEAGIEIKRAPLGMSRQKANKTQWHSERDCINWTVEWISEDGEKMFRSMPEDMPIVEAYRRLFTHAHVRRGGGGKKRKREGKEEDRNRDGAGAGAAGKMSQIDRSREETQQAPGDEAQASAGAQEEGAPRTGIEQQQQQQQQQQPVRPRGELTPPPSPPPPAMPAASIGSSESTKQKKPRAKHQHQKQEPMKADEPPKHFYLHTPLRAYPAQASTKTEDQAQVRVVVPLQPDQTLRDVLPTRTLLEFPTIYALTEPISSEGHVQRGLVTEAAWRRKMLGIEEVSA